MLSDDMSVLVLGEDITLVCKGCGRWDRLADYDDMVAHCECGSDDLRVYSMDGTYILLTLEDDDDM